ncbi:hypothetical protein AB1Y20_020282 [Prymnesium parvum]|uniref:SMP-LTD domain-containing protein n=1 Tax=Prymnesium parvum TaxID=97485 RepID=A0AB34JT02_PRYPA
MGESEDLDDQGDFRIGFDYVRHGFLSPLAAVERALQSSTVAVRGLGDAIAVGTGGSIRAVGSAARTMGSGLGGLSAAIAGEQSGAASDREKDAAQATRRLLSRPVSLMAHAVRSAADAAEFLGDTTEKLAAEAMGIVPDTMHFFESSVRGLREGLGAHAEGAEGSSRGSRRRPRAPLVHAPRLHLRRASALAEQEKGMPPPPAAEPADETARREVQRKGRGVLGELSLREPRVIPHMLLAFGAIVLLSPVAGRLGKVVLLLLAVLYLQQVDDVLRADVSRKAEASALHALSLQPRVAPVGEPVGWLNAILASGWSETIKPVLLQDIMRSTQQTFDEMKLPKPIKSISLKNLQLGPQPPFLVSCGAAAGTGPWAARRPGCVLQVELLWESATAEVTISVALANVASHPKLRLRRPSLRGTLRVQWEWIHDEPYIGMLRFCFIKPPRLDIAVEPLSVVDVTSVPGIGQWVRDALREHLFTSVCYPNWVEIDMQKPKHHPAPDDASTNVPPAALLQVAAAANAASRISRGGKLHAPSA